MPMLFRPRSATARWYVDDVTHHPWTHCPRATIVGGKGTRMNVLEKFGQRVREKRAALRLSQEAFADKCKLDRTYISGIERGKRNVSLRNIEAIAKAVGVSIAELLEGV
jgi:ribosome-binding protein aMBF1 (putative translation factor)